MTFSHPRAAVLITLVAALLTGCSPEGLPDHGPLLVSCDAPSLADHTSVHVFASAEALAAGGRVLVRADSLASDEGPIFDSPRGSLAQVFATTGPGYGCATTEPVGIRVMGPGLSLQRAWIHVKTDLPVEVTLRGERGEALATVIGTPGDVVPPLEWEPRR